MRNTALRRGRGKCGTADVNLRLRQRHLLSVPQADVGGCENPRTAPQGGDVHP